MHILLVGNGKMANAMEIVCGDRGISCIHIGKDEVVDYDEAVYISNEIVAVHFGSGRQLNELIDLCEERDIPLIQGSTRGTKGMPEDREVLLVKAPNLSLPMIQFVSTFPDFAEKIRPGMDLSIMESHQSTKKDTSGTARAIAGKLNYDEDQIEKVRSEQYQLELGVPKKHLNGHAYHFFTLEGQGVKIKISTEINGRETYAEGALVVAQALLDIDPRPPASVHELKDVLHLLPK